LGIERKTKLNRETWKDVAGYAGLYQVSDLGRVRSLGRECNSKNDSRQKKAPRILTQEVTIHGYCRVRLYDAEGRPKHFAVHRLVIEAFNGISDDEINHINEIKTDNRLANLEYCTHKYNCNFGTRNKRIGEKQAGNNSHAVIQIKDGKIINRFNSRMEAEAKTGISAVNIGRACAGTRKSAGGSEWRNI